ncbi:hypothetical protein POM88_043796 [Heracleum sosnowskyi]|uniref:Uncharacterized protein n=1 Tax=Heracleum sosnowskyi TaxID=360622 RepID=A0AAD8H471_9APIA|nr:hypothetical protein POM88_043796 [Heracleum sosnowskyi]
MMMMTKNKKISLVTDQDIEAALQLIQLKNHYQNFVTTNSDEHPRCEIDEPFTKIVLKSKEFLEAQDIKHNKKKICKGGYENIRKRKSDGITSCLSSLTFDLDDSGDEDANEAVCSVRKMKKFRSIVDIYNATKPL